MRIGDAKLQTANSGEIVGKRIYELDESALIEDVCSSASFKKFVHSKMSWVDVDPPGKIIKILANRQDRLRLPCLPASHMSQSYARMDRSPSSRDMMP